ncbi:MAG: thiamine ABC transporter substrate-binding protein [Acidimicrobiia bacterium]|jgi:thiamine transport system substrate-binding protein|nr:thiamine ABC transporter substrate-binding protein [Acidimicrobiia bacterium]MBP8180400.1 thiamine ABC transporter substrate-binding protein [Acidimicrobiia bacterium]
MTHRHPSKALRLLCVLLALVSLLAACNDDSSEEDDSGSTPTTTQVSRDDAGGSAGDQSNGTTVRVMVHDSVAMDTEMLAAFEAESGIAIELVPSGDAGSMVNEAVLAKDDPLADVIYGVDNTFLPVALSNGILTKWQGSISGLGQVPRELQVGDEPVVPVDYGEVCVNADVEAITTAGVPMPETLDDLASEEYKGLLVVEDPRQSSPGLAFLLATVSEFGEDGWEGFWEDLKANDVLVSGSWETAYFDEFSGAGDGARPLVVSYSTSPAAEAIYAEEPLDEVHTVSIPGTCARQIEYAGVLKGTRVAPEAGKVLDFFLSKEFQERVAADMFMYPARQDAAIPSEFEKFAPPPQTSTELPSLSVDEREELLRSWTELMG